MNLALLIEQADDRLGGFLIELTAVGRGDAANIARELDRRDLHPEAKAEIGHVVFARELGRADFSFHAALAKTAGIRTPATSAS